MNERIEELARQCYVKTGSTHTDHFEYWKFAELIVRECVQICKTLGSDQVSNASKDYQEGRKMGIEVCCNMIKKHFGGKDYE
jgi:hypothetical protein